MFQYSLLAIQSFKLTGKAEKILQMHSFFQANSLHNPLKTVMLQPGLSLDFYYLTLPLCFSLLSCISCSFCNLWHNIAYKIPYYKLCANKLHGALEISANNRSALTFPGIIKYFFSGAKDPKNLIMERLPDSVHFTDSGTDVSCHGYCISLKKLL